MNTKELTPIDAQEGGATRPTRRRGRARRIVAVAAVGLIGLSACASDPGPKRVATDIIESEVLRARERGEIASDEEAARLEDCLLSELEKFTDEELRQISQDLESTDEATAERGEAALAAYELSLGSCR